MPSDLNWKEGLRHSAVSRGHVLTDKLTALVKIESLNSIVNLTGWRRGHVRIIHKLQILSCRTFGLLTRQKDIHLQCSFTHTHTHTAQCCQECKGVCFAFKAEAVTGTKTNKPNPNSENLRLLYTNMMMLKNETASKNDFDTFVSASLSEG